MPSYIYREYHKREVHTSVTPSFLFCHCLNSSGTRSQYVHSSRLHKYDICIKILCSHQIESAKIHSLLALLKKSKYTNRPYMSAGAVSCQAIYRDSLQVLP